MYTGRCVLALTILYGSNDDTFTGILYILIRTALTAVGI